MVKFMMWEPLSEMCVSTVSKGSSTQPAKVIAQNKWNEYVTRSGMRSFLKQKFNLVLYLSNVIMARAVNMNGST